MQWFVVQTKPRQEERAQYFLAEKGFEAYLPKMEVVSTRGHKRKLIEKPLFPNYIFSRFDQQESLAHVRWTKGVVKILPESTRSQPVDKEIIEGIKKLAQKDGVVRKRSLKPKDKIRIATETGKPSLNILMER